jgi:DNA-3-methyladenine glycosylase II
MLHFPTAEAHLSAACPVLAKVIDKNGSYKLGPVQDLFPELISSIVSQQLSVKAAATILGRVKALVDFQVYPDRILLQREEDLRAAGLSRAKVLYVRNVAEWFKSNPALADELPDMPDEDVIKHLTSIKGLGRWSVEMILMFTLRRPDVFPVGDLGIRRALNVHYGYDMKAHARELEAKAEEWRPYRTVASLHLWRSIEG